MELIVPDRSILGCRKHPADVQAVARFFVDHVQDVDASIVSMDMLLYGGLVPSRLHHEEPGVLRQRLHVLREAKTVNPRIRLYAFMTLMRASQYNSADEEPDYYAQYGQALSRRAWLIDRIRRQSEQHNWQSHTQEELPADTRMDPQAEQGTTRQETADRKRMEIKANKEQQELDSISIPENVITDYEHRRNVNAELNVEALKLVGEGVIDDMILPQDDSAPYGYTAQTQARVLQCMRSQPSSFEHVLVYPGSDEVALTLMARAANKFRGRCPSVRVHYSSSVGSQIIPNYEDRPLSETINAHIAACGARFADDGEHPDVELLVNTPGPIMQEAQHWENHDPTYDSYRNLQDFVDLANRLVHERRSVAICDSAYSNGGDPDLIARLDEIGILSRICSYAGWNTNANTLGTALAQAILGNVSSDGRLEQSHHNLVARLLEDVFYQSIVRWKTEEYVRRFGADYHDVSSCENEASIFVRNELLREYNKLQLSNQLPIRSLTVTFPWHRLFEIDCRVQLVGAA